MEHRAVFEEIKKRRSPDRTVIIGIDGLGGAGKSTVSKALKKFLRRQIYKLPFCILTILFTPEL